MKLLTNNKSNSQENNKVKHFGHNDLLHNNILDKLGQGKRALIQSNNIFSFFSHKTCSPLKHPLKQYFNSVLSLAVVIQKETIIIKSRKKSIFQIKKEKKKNDPHPKSELNDDMECQSLIFCTYLHYCNTSQRVKVITFKEQTKSLKRFSFYKSSSNTTRLFDLPNHRTYH